MDSGPAIPLSGKDTGKVKLAIDKIVSSFPWLTREQAYAILRGWQE